MTLTQQKIDTFRKTIYDYYETQGRSFPWRETTDPYHILVSEIMLQQTQTDRVRPKYEEFVAAFPNFPALAEAPLSEVLRVWQGLGYNRRAMALRKAAQIVVENFGGNLPEEVDTLKTLPGIGPATASSIAAFAFNKPTLFVETNIRTLFIHFFFDGRTAVDDSEILTLVDVTLDRTQPRHWYFALMDYGVMLKKAHGNAGRRSVNYRKQSPFAGSDRQIRGGILRGLLQELELSEEQLSEKLQRDKNRVARIADVLEKEGFIRKKGKKYSLCSDG
jgi:A/G-specific adenine glycosylase